MPFKSRKQSAACFATHGFNHQINCDEWAKATNYKNLKKMGGKRGKCKYGCMQDGGQTPVNMRMQGKQDPFNFMGINSTCPPGYYWSSPDNQCKRIQVATSAVPTSNASGYEWMNFPPLATTPVTPSPTQQWHGTGVPGSDDFENGLPDDHPDKKDTSQSAGSTSLTQTTTQAPYHNWNQDIFFGLRGAQMAASFLAGKKRDALMNQYDYKQKSALGQMNPMPISQFQYSENDYTTPNRLYAQQGGMMNPYSYHSKYGGNLKTILREYGKWSNDAGPMDMTDGTGNPNKAKGGIAIDDMVVRDFISKLMQFGRGPHPYAGPHRSRMARGGKYRHMKHPKRVKDTDMDEDMMGDMDHDMMARGGRRPQHTAQQQGQQQQIMQIIQAYAQMNGSNPQQIMQQLQQMPPQQRQQAIQQMAQAVQQGQQQPQPQPQDQQAMMATGGWLKGAVNPAHKGWCTPLSNPHCTGHRRAFALMMKKNHGFHK